MLRLSKLLGGLVEYLETITHAAFAPLADFGVKVRYCACMANNNFGRTTMRATRHRGKFFPLVNLDVLVDCA